MRWVAISERTLALVDDEGNSLREVAREGSYLEPGDEELYGVSGGADYTQHPSLAEAKRAAEASI